MLRQDGATGQDGTMGGTASSAPLPGAERARTGGEQFRSAGADVSLTVEGDTGRLPATTGLAVYRILQEALTNAVKHAPGSATVVRLAVGPGTVTLTTETLTASSRAEPGNGTGLGVAQHARARRVAGRNLRGRPATAGWCALRSPWIPAREPRRDRGCRDHPGAPRR